MRTENKMGDFREDCSPPRSSTWMRTNMETTGFDSDDIYDAGFDTFQPMEDISWDEVPSLGPVDMIPFSADPIAIAIAQHQFDEDAAEFGQALNILLQQQPRVHTTPQLDIASNLSASTSSNDQYFTPPGSETSYQTSPQSQGAL